MERNRTDNNFKESGIALVTALIISAVILMLISSVTYIFIKGLGTGVINRQFATVYEAANGGVEYATGIINDCLDGTCSTAKIGEISPDAATLLGVIGCSTTATATILARTADGDYSIRMVIQCLGNKPVPGYGGALRFPPPPGASGGGIGSVITSYVFFNITAEAKETGSPYNIARTNAVYRVVK
ncbi:MAG: hypothetical protein AB1610_03445 [Nitrospirota bacterium]